MKVVTLVPWRTSADVRRSFNRDVTREYLEALGYPIFEAAPKTDEWSRAEALNRAATDAGAWDVAVVTDSDVILDSDSIRRAIAWVQDTKGGVRPYVQLRRLTARGSLRFAQRGFEWNYVPKQDYEVKTGGGILVLHREAFEAVDGWDERFRGPGREDTAMNISLIVKASYDLLPGQAWHLWHESQWEKMSRETDLLWRRYHAEHEQVLKAWAETRGMWAPLKMIV